MAKGTNHSSNQRSWRRTTFLHVASVWVQRVVTHSLSSLMSVKHFADIGLLANHIPASLVWSRWQVHAVTFHVRSTNSYHSMSKLVKNMENEPTAGELTPICIRTWWGYLNLLVQHDSTIHSILTIWYIHVCCSKVLFSCPTDHKW